MTTAYGSNTRTITTRGDEHADRLPYIPLRAKLNDGRDVIVDFVRTCEEEEAVRALLNDLIEAGCSWPFSSRLSEAEFRDYFFAHTALVARSDEGALMGAFYCKPNFPGRCSHYCNGGFLTHPEYRRRGVANVMVPTFLRVAADLGFHAVLFNLVFASNVPSVRLWEKFGFTRIGTLPDCGHLRSGVCDAYQYYYDLRKVNIDQ